MSSNENNYKRPSVEELRYLNRLAYETAVREYESAYWAALDRLNAADRAFLLAMHIEPLQ